MKVLQIVGVTAAVILAVSFSGCTPKNYDVHRETVIKAPAEAIFKNISRYENFPKWSPWQGLDTAMTTAIEGIDGTVGAKYSWKGNDKAGEGSMTFTKIEENKSVEQALEFLKPFKSSSTTYMNLEPAEGGTKVTWGMRGESALIARIMLTFMGGMDKAVGKDYEKGLAQLKTLSESSASSTPAYEVKETDWTEKNTLSFRQEVKFQDMGQFFGMHYSEIDKAIKGAGAREGIPLGVYYKYDKEAKSADLAAAIPYEGKKVLAKGYSDLKLPASKAYLVDFWGPYSGMEGAHTALQAKMKEIGKDHPDLVIEEYISDPMAEKDSTKWETKVYYLVK